MKKFVGGIFFLLLAFPAMAQNDTTRTAKTYAVSEVVVTGTRNETDVRHLPMTVSVIDRTTIEQSMRPSLLPLLTEQVPGLFTTARGVLGYGVSGGAAGGISIRGLSGSSGQMMVLIDGHPQYMGLMGHPISDSYQPLMTERVEVLRGPASVLYGSNAMGGVINIVTRKMQDDGVKTDISAGYGSFNTLETEITNRVRAGKFTSVIAASYNRTDGHRRDMVFDQCGGYAKLGYEFAKAWNARADVQITHFNASNPGEVSAPLTDADQRITRGMTSVAVENRYEKTSGAFSFFYNFGNHWINDGYDATAGESPLDYRYRSRDDMLGVSLYQSAQFFKGNRLTAGVDYYHFGGEAWNDYVSGEQAGERSDIADKTQDEIAGYLDFRQDIGAWLTLDAAVRIDHHSQAGTEWVPQAGLSFRLPKNVGLKVSASKGFRFPTIREMYMFPPHNPDLKPERMWNYELAFSQRVGSVSYGINIFYIDGDNLIQTVRTDGRPQNVNTGEIKNAGVEAQAAWRISDAWSVDANYSYLHMKNPVLAAPEHKLYAGAAYTAGRWQASTGIQYIAGLYTAVGEQAQTEDFVLWNAQVAFRATKLLSLWARGENLLAQRYEINAGFPMPRATVMAGIKIHF